MTLLTFDQLVEFIEHGMRMSHIYQPLLIRSLVDTGGTATIRQFATAFLDRDESQVLYYEDRIKKMPVPVLARHGVVERDGDLLRLLVDRLTYEQRADLVMLCEQKLGEFVKRRGMATWDYRLVETDPVSSD